MSHHKHSFSVDAACDGCGMMLSEVTTQLMEMIRSHRREMKDLWREREEDRAAIRALHAIVETIRMQVSAEYLAPLACFDDVKTHSPAIQRATQVPA